MYKAISPIIGAVILVAIVMAIGVLLSSSFTSIFKEQSTTAYDKGSCVGSSLDIMSVKCEPSAYDYSDPDLVGYWSLDSVNATNYTSDLTGNGNDGRLMKFNTDPAVVTGGKIGNGLQFDGSNDYVNVNSCAAVFEASSFTVEIWIKSDTLADWERFLDGKNGYGGVNGFVMKFKGGGIGIENDGSTTVIISTADLNLNEWNHVAFSHLESVAGDTNFFVINGVLEQKNTNITVTDTQGLGIGGNSRANLNADCQIDEVRIYNRSLSADEILQHYNHHKLKLGIFNTGQTQLNNITITSRIGTNIYTNVTSISLTSGEGKIIETNTSRGELSQLRVSAKNCPIFIEKNNETIDIVNCN